jgi:SCF-associated factor 1
MRDIIRQKNDEFDLQGDKKAVGTADGTIPCVTWSYDEDPLRLPSIPTLPSLGRLGEEDQPTQLVKIAGLEGHLIGLTNKGHVLIFRALEDEATAPQGRWHYVSPG